MPKVSLDSSQTTTPMLQQYLEIKEKYKDTILFYRIGDFYEMFYEDAVVASKVLDIVLTSRNKNDSNPVPLCGVPHHSMQPYLEKLVEKGFKVAICDQVEDPETAKGVVRREVTRVVTPGLMGVLESDAGKVGETHYLCAIHRDKKRWGLALLDIATGDFRVTDLVADPKVLLEELITLRPREIILSELDLDGLKLSMFACVTRLPNWVWEESYARKILQEQFGVTTLSGFQCEDIPEGLIAAGAVFHYVRETQKVERLKHITALKKFERGDHMILGPESRDNLSLQDLIEQVNFTRTSMGRRRLQSWFEAPLLKKDKIEARLNTVEELLNHQDLSSQIQKELDSVYDLERINSRLSLGTANARDLKALGASLQSLNCVETLISEFQSAEIQKISSAWDSFSELAQDIEKHIVEEPPFVLKDGGLICDGVHSELDTLRKLRQDAKSAIAAIEDRERKRTGIHSLKIHFNRVFGYYLEVSTTHLSKVPIDFIRKQTLANAERYITPELKEFEDKVLGAEGRIKILEYEIFCGLRDRALQQVPELQAQASRVATLDAFLSFAQYARENKTIRPQIEESGVLEVRSGRHPLVEKNLPSESYVPNDLTMHVDEDRLLIITGPNMAGKSTVIRQVGVLVLMAQAGSFVPAASLRLGLVDRIFTRVGAADRLARGESTFMVEMCETAAILHHATERSLVLLDEIGRGTSTFDGLSIAWAVAEHLHDKIKARTLFATHYHELIDLALTRPGIKNYNVQIQEEKGEIIFLYRLVPGGMSHSYGIHVAKLAGLPPEVVERSKEVLKNLEQGELESEGMPRIGKKRPKKEGGQFGLF